MCFALNEKEKWETCKNCVFFFSERRVLENSNSGNKWEDCEEVKRKGNGSSLQNYIHWLKAND